MSKRRALQKFLSWEQAGLPSQFAVIFRGITTWLAIAVFFITRSDGKDEIEIGYRLHPDYWNRGLASEAAQAVRDLAFRDLNLAQGHFTDSFRQCPLPGAWLKKWDDDSKRHSFSRIPNAGFCDYSGGVAGEA